LEPQALSRAARDAFRDILGNPSLSGRELTIALEGAGSRHGVEPCCACLEILSFAPRPEGAARRTLAAIAIHRDGLQERLRRDPGFAVAAADYRAVAEGEVRRSALVPDRRSLMVDPGDSALDDLVKVELRRCERAGRPLSLVLLRPDLPGLDEPAARLAGAALREASRGVDRAVRLLPDGYAVVLPCIPGPDGVRAAARLRDVVERATRVAWSAGVAAVPGVRPDPEALAASARAALSLARVAGGAAVRQLGGDRRRRPRGPAGRHLAGWVVAGGTALRASFLDLSLGGARLRLDERLPPGTPVVLRLRETTPRARGAAVSARVVRCVPQGNGDAGDPWHAALAFEPSDRTLLQMADLIATPAALSGSVSQP